MTDLENTPAEEQEQEQVLPAMNSSTVQGYEQARLEHQPDCWQRVR